VAQVVMLVHEEKGRFGASFPDFPGCTTVARDLDELYRKAAEVVPFHAAGMAEDGAFPKVRSLAELRRDPAFQRDAADASLIGFVRADLPGRAVRVNISIEEDLLAAIDNASKGANETRSGFLAEAARSRLAKLPENAPKSGDQAATKVKARLRTDHQTIPSPGSARRRRAAG
jgi:predicted RNase H-like HicB family nuclease